MIDAMLAKSYVLGATQRQLTIEGHDWTPVCQLCVKLPTLEDGDAERFPSQNEDGRPVDGVRQPYTARDDALWGDGTTVTTDDVMCSWEGGRHHDTDVAPVRRWDARRVEE